MNGNLDPIIKLLQSHDESDQKQGIVDLLSSKDPLAAAILNKLAAQHPSVEIRYYARRALDSLNRRDEKPPHEPAADFSLKELFEAEDPKARFEGLKAALQAGTEEALAHIREGVGKEPVPQLQASFIIALGRLGSAADIPMLAKYLQHGDARIRANAVEALATIGTEEAYTFLVPVLQDEDNRVKSNVIKALQAYGGASVFELLKSMATESAVWMRDSALYSLALFKTPQALGLVGQIAVNDPLERIRAKAWKYLEALAGEGNDSARAILARLKSSQPPPTAPEQDVPGREPSPPVAEAREASDSIAALLASPEVEKRHWALLKIGQKPSAEDTENLLRALELETEPLLTGIILAILKNIKVPGAFQAIVPFLGSTDDRVRANAAEALAEIDSRQASEHLIALLEDPNNRVRANTILALSKDGILDPLEPTANLARDKRESYRRSALYVISCLRLPTFIPVIAKLLEDPDVRVRMLAYDVLHEYDKAGIIQARELRIRADSNIKMQKERDRFFENEFDRMFSGLLQSIRSDEPLKRTTNQILTPQKEKTAFCQLGKKAESKGVLPAAVLEALSRIDAEITRLKAISASLVTSSKAKTSAGNVKDGTRDMSESELIRVQLRKALDRRDALLADAGGAFVKG
ncbi:HEAT repeat domain-containing protein, partial [Candidatus Ozemobacteraceae bacterium]|nr:HEAT repeat domain-containing protein [Candidatus Ozemobacteraceae bacterium]